MVASDKLGFRLRCIPVAPCFFRIGFWVPFDAPVFADIDRLAFSIALASIVFISKDAIRPFFPIKMSGKLSRVLAVVVDVVNICDDMVVAASVDDRTGRIDLDQLKGFSALRTIFVVPSFIHRTPSHDGRMVEIPSQQFLPFR